MSERLPSFHAAMISQCQHMLREAKRLDEKGYAIIYRYSSKLTENAKLPHWALSQAYAKFFEQWRQNTRRRAVVISVSPSQTALYRPGGFETDIAKDPFVFAVEVPRTTRLRPIVATLELMSTPVKNRWDRSGANGMTACRFSNRFEFYGAGKTSLQTIISVLDMPHHREALLR